MVKKRYRSLKDYLLFSKCYSQYQSHFLSLCVCSQSLNLNLSVSISKCQFLSSLSPHFRSLSSQSAVFSVFSQSFSSQSLLAIPQFFPVSQFSALSLSPSVRVFRSQFLSLSLLFTDSQSQLISLRLPV